MGKRQLTPSVVFCSFPLTHTQMMTNLAERNCNDPRNVHSLTFFLCVLVVEKRATFVPLDSSVDGREGDAPSGDF